MRCNAIYLKLHKRVAESAFEVSSESGDTREFLPMKKAYYCNTSEAKDVPAVQHGTGRQRPCVRIHRAYDETVTGRESPSRVMAETMESRRRVKELHGEAGSLAGRDSSRKRRVVPDEKYFLPSEQ